VSEQCTRGIIFDLDGTLYLLRWMKLRMALLLPGSVGVLRKLMSARAVIRAGSYADRESLLAAMFQELGRRAGISAERAEAWYHERFMEAFVKLLGKSGRARAKLDGVLTRLRAANIKLAVVSDFGRVEDRLRALRIAPDLFDNLVAMEDYGVLKPSPRPMLALAAKWGIDPREIVIVGDQSDLDSDCARAAGMEFLGITDRLSRAESGFVDWISASVMLEARAKESGVRK
jgi:FMN phosphatase YigB (HAD superfamily)